MKSIAHFSVLLATCSLLLSCTTTTILKSNFAAVSIGATPPHDIPGDPTGDRVDFIPELNSGVKVRDWNASGDKALEFSYTNIENIHYSNTYLSFREISTNFRQTICYVYTAKHTGTYGVILTDLSDGAGTPVARMKITPAGRVTLVGSDWTTEREIGNVPPDVAHTVIYTINASTLRLNLQIFVTGRERIQVENVPLMATSQLDFHNPTNPSIAFNFDSHDVGTGRRYIIQNMLITRKEPTAP